nr:hypothetical protein OHB51_24915 [Micromonospora sp. NBC_00855]
MLTTAAAALVCQPLGSDSGDRRASSAGQRRRAAWVAKMSTQVVAVPNNATPSSFANGASGETRDTVRARLL